MQTYTIPVDPGSTNYRVIPPIYRGDGVAIEVHPYDRSGHHIHDLTFYDVVAVLSRTPSGHPSNAPDIARKHLVNGGGKIVAPGVVRFEFTAADLVTLIDKRSYYINSWSRSVEGAPTPQGTAVLTIYPSLSADVQPDILPTLEAGEEYLAFTDDAFIAFGDDAMMTNMEPVSP